MTKVKLKQDVIINGLVVGEARKCGYIKKTETLEPNTKYRVVYQNFVFYLDSTQIELI